MFDLVKYTVLGTIARFKKEEDGVALTEYLVLLGLLTGAVIAAVILFGTNLTTAWEDWADWMAGLAGGPADSTTTP